MPSGASLSGHGWNHGSGDDALTVVFEVPVLSSRTDD